jgi:hypothetical protein
MVPSGKGLIIVRTYQKPNAPTEEGAIYVDQYGIHWREVTYLSEKGTGDRHGIKIGSVIQEI